MSLAKLQWHPLCLFFRLVLLFLCFFASLKNAEDEWTKNIFSDNCRVLTASCDLDETVNTSSIFNVLGFAPPIVAHHCPPTVIEMKSFQDLPRSLTRANFALGNNLKALAWVQRKGGTWSLPADHPRNNKTICVKLSQEAAEGPIDIYNDYKIPSKFFVLHVRQALIHDMGIVGLQCGYVQAVEGCETFFRFIGRKWHSGCMKNLTIERKYWRNMFDDDISYNNNNLTSSINLKNKNSTSLSCEGRPALRLRRVFLITTGWDNNYHHFLVDSISRLVRHLDWLQANPDVMIHIRRFEQLAKKERYIFGGMLLRLRILELLGIDPNRIVSGPVLADEAFIPKATKCNSPLSHALELRYVSFLYTRHACVNSCVLFETGPHLSSPATLYTHLKSSLHALTA